MDPFEEALRESLEALAGPGAVAGGRERFLAGYSGGPDSTALALALARILPDPASTLTLAYYDHGIRPLAEREAELFHVRAFAEGLGLNLTMGASPPGEIARAKAGKGIEAEARRARHAFLESAGEGWILLGHTLDDQCETLAMRFFSASGPAGLSGIPARRGRILRPLLGVPKAACLAYLGRRGVSAFADSSNAGQEYLRNRVRQRLMPAAAEIFPSCAKSLAALADRMARVSRFLDAECAARIPWERRGPLLSADAAAFHRADPALRLRSLELQAGRLSPGERMPYALLRKLATGFGEGFSGAMGSWRGHVLEQRRGCILFVPASIVTLSKTGYSVTVRGPGSYPAGGGLLVEASWEPSPAPFPGGLAEGSFSFPLEFRTARAGDRIACRSGSKELGVLMGEWGVPLGARGMVPVVADRDGVAALLGSAVGFRDRMAERGFPPPGARAYLALRLKGVDDGIRR